MTGADSFFKFPAGTRAESMRATYLALCEHGDADLTIQRIGDEFPESKSLIYHHNEGKDDLLRHFLSFMLEQFEDAVPFQAAEAPGDHLDAVLDHASAVPPAEMHREFTRALIELRGQAAHVAKYRDHFTRHDRFFTGRITEIVESGIEAGVFRDVDSDEVAAFLLATINGSIVQRVTSDAEAPATLRERADAYVRTLLLEG